MVSAVPFAYKLLSLKDDQQEKTTSCRRKTNANNNHIIFNDIRVFGQQR